MDQAELLDKRKQATRAELDEVMALFLNSSEEYALLTLISIDLHLRCIDFNLNGISEKKLNLRVLGVKLNINKRDSFDVALDKIDSFLAAVKDKKNAEITEVGGKIGRAAGDVNIAAESVAAPLVPEKGRTEWRDVNAEIEKLANAFALAGKAEEEAGLRDLRKKSHRRQLGKEDYSLVIGEDTFQVFDDDTDDKILVKLARFVAAVKEHNSDLGNKIVSAAPAGKREDIEPIFWRDVISGIDALIKAYPDDDFSAVADLRDSLQRGEIGRHDRLLLSVGAVHLNIKKTDDAEMMKEKIAVFIGELKQVASAGKKGTEKPLDPALSKTYWRDILGAMKELDAAYGENPQFKLLRISIEKGVLGTVRDFHATIDGVNLDINQSDTDLQMQDKLTRFIRALNKEGQVKINDDVRKEFAKLEKEYAELERQKMDLESRYKNASSDMRKQEKEIKRLENANTGYEAEIRRLQAELQRAQASSYTPSPSYYPPSSGYTTRSYGG